MIKMVFIDISELKDEEKDLQNFLEDKLSVEIKVDGKTMNIDSAEAQTSRGKIKEYLNRFFYRKKLTDTYTVRTEKEGFKIIKKKT